MANELLRYCATDKEIYDLLMSARQRINESAIQEIARSRGIFYSPLDTRESLASNLSLLPHDFDALVHLLDQSENPSRAEKVTSVTLNAKLTVNEIKEVATAYKESVPKGEKVIARVDGPDKYVMQVEYSELDYAKTRLLQRRSREAEIKFVVEGDKTTIRMPANEKARSVVDDLMKRLAAEKKAAVPAELIEISDLPTDGRNEFFTDLITAMEGFQLNNVTNVKVHSGTVPKVEEEAADEEEEEEAAEKYEMLAVVSDVAIKGQSLLAAPEYQDLRKKNFYITSITWISKSTDSPYNRFEFDAGFEYPEEGRGFRYQVRGLYRRQDSGEYTKTIRTLSHEHKQEIFPAIERTARKVLASLRQKYAVAPSAEPTI